MEVIIMKHSLAFKFTVVHSEKGTISKSVPFCCSLFPEMGTDIHYLLFTVP